MTLLLLSPQIPMLFMGEEIGSRAPFLYFTDHSPELAKAVREGRRKEFAAFAATHGEIPDPNDPATFAASDPERDAPEWNEWLALVQQLLALRRKRITPCIRGAKSVGAEACGEKAVKARWTLGDGGMLTLAVNFGTGAIATALPRAKPVWGAAAEQTIPAMSALCWIEA
jgi:maltooligosyltrehalose trehalohydrolase